MKNESDCSRTEHLWLPEENKTVNEWSSLVFSFSRFYVLFCGFAFNKDIDSDCDPAHALSLIANGPGDPILEAKITPAHVSNGKRTKSLHLWEDTQELLI